MAAPSQTSSAFPSPYEVETPPGCEGWEEMYPYYALFDEARREADESRFWFWNSMHFPVPMPAFDVDCIDTPYQAIGVWQNRVFAVPPAMGIDYRIRQRLRLHLRQPGHRPGEDRRARRVLPAARRATTTRTGTSSTPSGKDEDGGADRGDHGAARSRPPRVRARRGRLRGRPEHRRATRSSTPTSATLRCADLMWQHHFEFLLLGYGAYMTFAEFCKAQLPDIPDQHVAQMVAGIDVLLFRPTPSCAGWRGSRSTPASTARSSRAARPPRSTPSSPGSEAGRSLARGARAGQGPVVQHGHRRRALPLLPELVRRPERSRTPRSIGHIARAARRRGDRAPDSTRSRAERDRLAEEYGELIDEEARATFDELLGPLAHGVPLRRGAQVLLRLLVPHALVEQDARVRRRCSPSTASSRTREDIFQLARHEVGAGARRAVADVGHRAARRSGPRTGRRSSRGARSCSSGWASGRRRPAVGRDARGDPRPGGDHALGRHDGARAATGRAPTEGGWTAARERPRRPASSRVSPAS